MLTKFLNISVYSKLMQNVFSVRIPKELREKMKQYDVDWKEVIVDAIVNKINQIEAERALEELKKMNEKIEVSKNPAWRDLREAREG